VARLAAEGTPRRDDARHHGMVGSGDLRRERRVSESRPNALPPGTVVHERYRVVAPVGHGGLGTVYQVTDILFGRDNVYALKEQWDQSESARKQFAREGAWLKALNHHHIPRVTEYFEWNGRLYLVMDFVDGENLEQKLANAGGRPLPEAQVLAWVIPICDALHYMHTRVPPLIHRDVKPSNIIVTPSGHPVLVDLGIAKEHAPGMNATATFVRKAGTEGYAPPEQYASAGQTGPWSDVYGMGATLYHLLTTQIPPTAVERVALDAPLRHPQELNPAVSPITDAALLRALAIRPQERFRSMVELQQALEAAAQATPALVPRSPLPYATSHPGQPVPVPPSNRSLGMPAPVQPPAMSPVTPTRTPTRRPVTAPTRVPTGARLTRPNALSVGADPSPEKDPHRERRPISLAHPAVWGGGLAAAIVVTAVVAVSLMRIYAPLDRSTPTAAVSGYFNALIAQDYSRAWQFTAASTKNQTSESEFAQGLAADDARLGRVLSVTIGAFQQTSSGQVTGTVSAVRARDPSASVVYSVVVTQYGNLWLIDGVSSS
jgi:serine/threonine-protein kinase